MDIIFSNSCLALCPSGQPPLAVFCLKTMQPGAILQQADPQCNSVRLPLFFFHLLPNLPNFIVVTDLACYHLACLKQNSKQCSPQCIDRLPLFFPPPSNDSLLHIFIVATGMNIRTVQNMHRSKVWLVFILIA